MPTLVAGVPVMMCAVSRGRQAVARHCHVSVDMICEPDLPPPHRPTHADPPSQQLGAAAAAGGGPGGRHCRSRSGAAQWQRAGGRAWRVWGGEGPHMSVGVAAAEVSPQGGTYTHHLRSRLLPCAHCMHGNHGLQAAPGWMPPGSQHFKTPLAAVPPLPRSPAKASPPALRSLRTSRWGLGWQSFQ